MEQENMQLPKMLRYSQIKPKGLPTRYKRVEINQMNNQQQFSFNDIIRFQFQTDSFIDPYQSYIELQVEVPQVAGENMPGKKSVIQYDQIESTGTTYNDAPTTGYFKNPVTQVFPDFSNVPLYILDGPATSFISEMIVYSNGREIERVTEYDQLGNLMADLGIHLKTRSKGGYYGLASSFGKSDFSYLQFQMNNKGNNNDNHGSVSYITPANPAVTTSITGDQAELVSFQNNNFTKFIPTNAGSSNISNSGYGYFTASQQPIIVNQETLKCPIPDYLDFNQVISTRPPQIDVGGVFNGSIVSYEVYQALGVAQQNRRFYDKYNDFQGLYSTTQTNPYTSILSGLKSTVPGIESQQLDNSAYINFAREFALQDGQYGVEHYDTVSITPFYKAETRQASTKLPFTLDLNTYSLMTNAEGFFRPTIQPLTNTDKIDFSTNHTLKRRKKILYNAASNQNNFTYFAPGIAQARWKDGKPITDFNIGGYNTTGTGQTTDCEKEVKLATTKKTFYIPILSGILGHLIPNDQWKLIPGKGCGVLNFEFRLNRFAMYMSGHKVFQKATGNTYDLKNSSSQFHSGRQGWKINKISLHFDLWDFHESVHQIVDQQLQNGIVMNSQQFVNGPTYSIANSNQLKGNWQINNSIQSLKKLYFWFLLDDYQVYNYCRKNFRISHNMKSIQLKLGQEFIPEQPITGHAGNMIEFNGETTKDYMPFYIELLRAHGEMFNPEGKIQILPQSFIVNDRAYDPSNVYQTQFQTAFLHETRLNGKAVFTIDMEADPFDFNTLSGKNIAQVKPVELQLDTHFNGAQTRPSTMFTLLHADALVQFSMDGIQVAI